MFEKALYSSWES